MSQTPEEKEIDGTLYELRPLMTTDGLDLWVKLIGLAGEPLGILADAVKTGTDSANAATVSNWLDRDLPPDTFSRMARSLTDGLAKSDVLPLIKKLLSTVRIKGPQDRQLRRIEFETDFQARYRHLAKVIMAALQANYGDLFLGAGQGDVVSLLKTAAAGSP